MSAPLESAGALYLEDPLVLLLALLLPLALWARRRRGQPALLFAPLGLFAGTAASAGERLLRAGWRVRLVGLPRLLEVLSLLLVVVALARPVERRVLPALTEGLEILLVLDVSSSMAARDLDPARTRLAIAKEAAAQFIAARPGDRIGLVTFARYPDLLSPPTLDHRALAQILETVERVEPEGPEDATGIGTALARAAQVLGTDKGAEDPAVARVVILLTDGEENVAGPHSPREIAPLAAAQLAALNELRVHAIAVGRGEPDGRGGWRPLATAELEGIARIGGGRFFEVHDARGLAEVYAEIDELETRALPEPRFHLEERFAPFLLAGLVLLLAGQVLGRSVLEVGP